LLASAGGPWGTALSMLVVALAGLAATVIPMRLGLRSFRDLEA